MIWAQGIRKIIGKTAFQAFVRADFNFFDL